MNCPSCHHPMTPGEIGLESTLADIVMGGGAFSELRFTESKQKPVSVMLQSDSKPALYCKMCGMVMIINDMAFTETECVVCHTRMPAGITSCPKCAWIYEQTS